MRRQTASIQNGCPITQLSSSSSCVWQSDHSVTYRSKVCFPLAQHAPVIKYQLYTLTISPKCPPLATYLRPILKEVSAIEPGASVATFFWAQNHPKPVDDTTNTHKGPPLTPQHHLSHQHSLQLFYYKSGFKPARPITPSPSSLSGRLEYPH